MPSAAPTLDAAGWKNWESERIEIPLCASGAFIFLIAAFARSTLFIYMDMPFYYLN